MLFLIIKSETLDSVCSFQVLLLSEAFITKFWVVFSHKVSSGLPKDRCSVFLMVYFIIDSGFYSKYQRFILQFLLLAFLFYFLINEWLFTLDQKLYSFLKIVLKWFVNWNIESVQLASHTKSWSFIWANKVIV